MPQAVNLRSVKELERRQPEAPLLLIERIIASQAFHKADRLKELLHYLAEEYLRGEGSVCTEHQIGQAVFGKPVSYSPSQDSSVRVHVRQLRLKLHEYFDTEGRTEPWVLEIPKGSYALAFHLTQVTTPQVPVSMPVLERRNISIREIAAWSAVVVLSFLLIFLLRRTPVPVQTEVPWPLSAVLANGHPSHVVLADASYGLRRLLSQTPVSLDDYVRSDDKTARDLDSKIGRRADVSQYVFHALLTSWADVAIARAFDRMVGENRERFSLLSARDLRARELSAGDFIFIGSPASNPWVLKFENRMNFVEFRGAAADPSAKSFHNKSPEPGEQDYYRGLRETGYAGEDFASIALLPLEDNRGNVMIIQGLHQEGTEAAGLWLASEAGRQKLTSALGVSTKPSSPVYFEVLLKTETVAGSPGSVSIVARRRLKY